MKLGFIFASAFALAVFVVSYAPPSAAASESQTASLAGMVVKDPTGEPLKKAIIELIGENQEIGNATATSDQNGAFKIPQLHPGRYRLFAERTGFVAVDARGRRSDGVVVTLDAGQEVKDVFVHMLPAGVVTGRVVDEDGDPMPGVNVALLHRHASPTGVQLDQVAGERTNDVGEYRIGGILPGRYYLSASPAPDFQSIVAPSKETPGKPDLAYVTTYYPNTSDRLQASLVEVRAGDEIPVDFSLVRTPTARIRGTVTGLAASSKAVVSLHSADQSLVFNETEVGKDGKFEIRDVAPGSYTLLAVDSENEKSRIAVQTVEVNGANVEGMRLLPQPGATVRGRVQIAGRPGIDLAQLTLYLQPANGNFEALNVIAHGQVFRVKADGSFTWDDVPPGRYYVEGGEGNEAIPDCFLDSVVAGGRELKDSGIVLSGGSVWLDVSLSASGAIVEGVVSNEKDVPTANAVVVAVPAARFRNRSSLYRKAASDQHGHFVLHGLPPGDYTLFAWDSLEGDAYSDPEFLKAYEGRGLALRVGKGERQTISLKLLAAADEQP